MMIPEILPNQFFVFYFKKMSNHISYCNTIKSVRKCHRLQSRADDFLTLRIFSLNLILKTLLL